jgi:predicted DsbA family dithiol-disulfide isomerase
MAKEAGLVMNRPAITPSTRLALEATEYAKLHGLGEEFHMAAYEAYWRDGVDLGKVENLKPIGDTVGLDWTDMSQHLEERTHRESVEHQYQEALGVGVTGIPAYVLGKYFFTGAQPYEMFKEVAERALLLTEQGANEESNSSEN